MGLDSCAEETGHQWEFSLLKHKNGELSRMCYRFGKGVGVGVKGERPGLIQKGKHKNGELSGLCNDGVLMTLMGLTMGDGVEDGCVVGHDAEDGCRGRCQ